MPFQIHLIFFCLWHSSKAKISSEMTKRHHKCVMKVVHMAYVLYSKSFDVIWFVMRETKLFQNSETIGTCWSKLYKCNENSQACFNEFVTPAFKTPLMLHKELRNQRLSYFSEPCVLNLHLKSTYCTVSKHTTYTDVQLWSKHQILQTFVVAFWLPKLLSLWSCRSETVAVGIVD